jgi:putative ABC transport system permease protein
MTPKPRAWRLARWWLVRVLPARAAADVIGDLREDIDRERPRRSALGLECWLLREAVALGAAYRRAARRHPVSFQGSLPMRMSLVLQQFRFSARALRRTPVFTLIATTTLAVGIGATTAVFSVVHQALLDPLPYPNAARLAVIAETRNDDEISVSYLNFLDWQQQSRSFDGLALFEGTSLTLPGETGAERVRAQFVGSDLFRVLGTGPVLGRAFTADEQRVGGPRVAMIGDALWRRDFASDPAVLSHTIQLDAETYQIIGVLPRGFAFPDGIVYGPAEVYLPLGLFIAQNPQDIANRASHPGLEAIGLLHPGVSIATARTELRTIGETLRLAYPADNGQLGVLVRDGITAIVGDLRAQLTIVMSAVALVLLIACANVAGLTLTRTASRARELALHAALGAPRWHWLSAPVAESIVIAVAGGSLGVGLATIALHAIGPAIVDLPRLQTVALSWRMVAWSAGLTIATGIVCGSAPALWMRNASLDRWLRQRGGSGGSRGRGALVSLQMGLALVLLLCAAVLTATLERLAADRGGVNPEGVLTFDARLASEASSSRSVEFFTTLDTRLHALPGITTVGAIAVMPFSGGGAQSDFGHPGDPPDHWVRTDVNTVTPDYFEAMGVSLLRGRAFRAADTTNTPAVAIIDERFAARFWPGASPIGQHVEGWGLHDLQVVGVVGHVKNYGPAAPSREELYVPFLQRPRTRMYLVLRTPGDPAALVPAVRQAVAAVDRSVAVGNVHTMRDLVDGTIAGTRISSLLSALFAAAALSLALIGLSGLVGYLVQLKRREIGIRLALGAGTGRVVGEILAHAARLTGMGIAFGVVIAFLLVRALRAQVAGVESLGFPGFVILPLGLLAVAMFASWLPARRAAGVSPTIALRDE